MKILIDGKILNGILKTIKPYVGNLRNLPVLRAVKITAADKVYITATNLDSSIVSEVPGAEVLVRSLWRNGELE